MCKQEALHSSLQLGDVHDLCKVSLHNGQLLGVALALVLGVLPLQCSQSISHTRRPFQHTSVKALREQGGNMQQAKHLASSCCMYRWSAAQSPCRLDWAVSSDW